MSMSFFRLPAKKSPLKKSNHFDAPVNLRSWKGRKLPNCSWTPFTSMPPWESLRNGTGTTCTKKEAPPGLQKKGAPEWEMQHVLACICPKNALKMAGSIYVYRNDEANMLHSGLSSQLSDEAAWPFFQTHTKSDVNMKLPCYIYIYYIYLYPIYRWILIYYISS